MSIENVKAFREALNESKELQEKIAAGEDWVEVAKAANFDFTKEELRKVLAVQESEELSESELEGVAGGTNADDEDVSEGRTFWQADRMAFEHA